MNKRETIDLIRRFNPTAPAEFLAAFEHDDLLAYLFQLQELRSNRARPALQSGEYWSGRGICSAASSGI